MREFVFGGLLISPFIKYALIAAIIFIPVRLMLVSIDFQKWFWHPLLAEGALYICILAILNTV